MRFEDFLALIEDYRWRIKTAGISRSAWRQGTKTNRALLKALAEAKVPIRVVRRGDRFDWGGPDRRILHPAPATSAAPTRARPANASIVYLLRMNGIDALFTGDIERPVAENVATLLDPALDDPVDNFLATHHGSKEARSRSCST